MSVSLFLRMPLELRLHIYSYLLRPEDGADDARFGVSPHDVAHASDYHEYKQSSGPSPTRHAKVLRIRNANVLPKTPSQTTYKVRSGRLRSACEDTTYICTNNSTLYTSILRVNWQLRREAVEVFYGSCIFDFDTHVEACVPFLMDLTPFARSHIRHVSVVKRALPYDKDFDRCEWSNMCECLSKHLQLNELSLGIVAGKPALGWEGLRLFRRHEFAAVIEMMDEMSWVDDIAAIKGLQILTIRACVEHSPPPMSAAMAFFVAFSASLEPNFADYLASRMLTPKT